MPIFSDGYIMDGISVGEAPDGRRAMVNASSIQLGQIVAIHPIEENRNWSSRYVEYDVMVFEDSASTNLYRNCKFIDSFGDDLNFNEVVLSSTTNVSSEKAYESAADIRNGAMVLVACLGGHKNQAVILGCVQHPSWNRRRATSPVPEFEGEGSSVSRDEDMVGLPTLLPGAKADDGQRILGEFNGFRWNVNADGELTVMFQGPKDKDGKLTSDAGPTILKLNKSGEFVVIDKLDQEIKISPSDGKITISSGDATPAAIVVDRNQKKIFVGSEQAVEPMVLGNQLVAQLSSLLTTLITQNLANQAGVAALVAPTGIAAPAKATWSAALIAEQTQLVAAQSILQQLLSQKCFTELGP